MALHPIWPQKLCSKQSIAGHQLIYGPLAFCFLLFYQVSSHIEELQMKSFTTKYAKLITIFQRVFKIALVQMLRTSWLSYFVSRLIKDLLQETFCRIRGSKTWRTLKMAKNLRMEPLVKFKHKNTYQSRRGPNHNALTEQLIPLLKTNKTIRLISFRTKKKKRSKRQLHLIHSKCFLRLLQTSSKYCLVQVINRWQ